MNELDALIAALQEQTQAINKLVQTNAALIQALADVEEVEAQPVRYMDGSPVE